MDITALFFADASMNVDYFYVCDKNIPYLHIEILCDPPCVAQEAIDRRRPIGPPASGDGPDAPVRDSELISFARRHALPSSPPPLCSPIFRSLLTCAFPPTFWPVGSQCASWTRKISAIFPVPSGIRSRAAASFDGLEPPPWSRESAPAPKWTPLPSRPRKNRIFLISFGIAGSLPTLCNTSPYLESL